MPKPRPLSPEGFPSAAAHSTIETMHRTLTPTRAWTLGFPPAYEVSVRMKGNGKAPAGYIFRTRQDAADYAASHPKASKYEPYEVELPDVYEACTTRRYLDAASARHAWHTAEGPEGAQDFMPECGVCLWQGNEEFDHDLLKTVAPFINPDTGEVA